MKTKLICSVVLLAASAVLTAGAQTPSEMEGKLEKCTLQSDVAGLKPLVAKLDSDLAAAPADSATLYWRALGHYAEASVARAKNDKDAAADHLDEAIGLLKKVKNPAWEAEAQGLQGYLCNQMIGVKGMGVAMFMSPKSQSLLGKARAKAPENARVLLFNGESLVTTPEMFGGDLAGGIELLEKAVAAFDKAPADAAVHWGKAEALAWLGFGKQKAGDMAGARAAWERALAVEPEYGWVKHALLPSLDAASSEKKS